MTLSRLFDRWGRATSIALAAVLATTGLVALTAAPASAAAGYSSFTIQDQENNPLQGAIVTLTGTDAENSGQSREYESDSTGTVNFDPSDHGLNWRLYVAPPAYTGLQAQYWDRESVENTESIHLYAGGGVGYVILAMKATSSVAGTVVASTAPEVGIQGVDVSYSAADGGPGGYTSTGADGEYSLDLAPGTYTASFSKYSTSASYPFSFAPTRLGEFEITTDPVAPRLTEITPNGRVSGSVGELVDGEYSTAHPATVMLYSVDGDELSSQPFATTSDGDYSFVAPPGTYKVGFGDVSSMFSLRQAYDRAPTIAEGTVVTVGPNSTTSRIDGLFGYTPAVPAVVAGTPAISGDAVLGSTLSAVTGSWIPADVDFVYEWLRSGETIPGAVASTYAPTAADVGSVLAVRVTGSKAGYSSVSATSPASAVVVDPSPGSVTVTVADPGGAPVAGAWVSVYGDGADRWFSGPSDAAGSFVASGLASGEYRVTASPSTAGGIAFLETVTVASGVHLNVAATIRAAIEPPVGTTLTPSRNAPGTVPSVFSGQALSFTTTARAAATSATYTIVFATGAPSVTGSLVESPAGTYTASIPGLDGSGAAVVTASFGFATGAPQVVSFDIYIDPSGTVVDQYGTPVADATVTVSRSDTETGAFTVIPDGSPLLSPSNRTNPDTTGTDGRFAWDVVPGWYKVTAEKNGVSFVTAALPVPPEQLDLVLPLQFPALAPPTAATAPAISGMPAVGSALTVSSGAWPAVDNQPSAITQTGYQWTRDGVAIAGATADTHTLVAADAGHAVAVVVTAGRAGFQSWTVTAAAVAVPANTTVVGGVIAAVGGDTRALAATGVEATGSLAVAALLLAFGATMLLLRRRRAGNPG